MLALVAGGWWFLGGDDGGDPAAGHGTPAAQARPAPATTSTSPAAPSVKAPPTAPPNEDVNGDQVSYDASNMLDGVPDTAWRVPGDATG